MADTIDFEETFDKIYSELDLDWLCHSMFTDVIDGRDYVFFVKNDLIDKDKKKDSCVAVWVMDGSMVVGVEL